VANELVTGASNVAARGLRAVLGLDDDAVLAGYMLDPTSAMTVEMLEHSLRLIATKLLLQSAQQGGEWHACTCASQALHCEWHCGNG